MGRLSYIESLNRSSQTYVIYDYAVRDVFLGDQAMSSKKDEVFFEIWSGLTFVNRELLLKFLNVLEV